MAAGVLIVVQSLVSIPETPESSILYKVNHCADAFIFLSLFCDVFKMTFGLDPAVPYTNEDVEIFKP